MWYTQLPWPSQSIIMNLSHKSPRCPPIRCYRTVEQNSYHPRGLEQDGATRENMPNGRQQSSCCRATPTAPHKRRDCSEGTAGALRCQPGPGPSSPASHPHPNGHAGGHRGANLVRGCRPNSADNRQPGADPTPTLQLQGFPGFSDDSGQSASVDAVRFCVSRGVI